MSTKIEQHGIVAIIRGAKPEKILQISEALLEGGVKTLEITVETPKVLTLIESVRDEFGEDLIVGAGTVLDPETARAAIMLEPSLFFRLRSIQKRFA